jgi:hypothetical protein
MDIIKDSFQPGTLSFRDLGALLQGSSRSMDFPAQPVANAMRIPETIFHRIDNVFCF